LQQAVTHFSAEWSEELNGQSVRVAGLVTHIRGHQTRTGKAMAFVTLEDLQGAIEITVFPNLWSKVKDWLKTNAIALVEGKAEYMGTTPRVLAESISPELTPSGSTKPVSAAHRASKAPSPAVPASAPSPTPAPEVASIEPVFDPEPDWDNLVPPEPFVEGMAGVGAPGAAAAPIGLGPLAHASGAPRATTGVEAAVLASAPMLTPAPSVQPEATPAPGAPRMITVILRETGDRPRDVRRLRHVHGLLASYPGPDHFALHIYEGSRAWRLEFPNETTGFGAELELRLRELLGPDSLEITPWRVQ